MERDQLGGVGVSRIVAVRGNVTEGSREETDMFLYLQSLQRVGYVIILPDYMITRVGGSHGIIYSYLQSLQRVGYLIILPDYMITHVGGPDEIIYSYLQSLQRVSYVIILPDYMITRGTCHTV